MNKTLVSLGLSYLLTVSQAYGDGCQAPSLAIAGGAAWWKGSTITLYVVSPSGNEFTTPQQNDIKTAFDNWSSNLGANLTFNRTVVSSAPSSPSGLYIVVQWGSTTGCGAGKTAC